MASQLRFEGRELEELLERVRREVGVDAHIIEANRIRKGGIGGFFAKEGYEVLVDAPVNGTPRPAPGRARVPTSVLDLAEETSASEREQVIDLSEPARVSTDISVCATPTARLASFT